MQTEAAVLEDGEDNYKAQNILKFLDLHKHITAAVKSAEGVDDLEGKTETAIFWLAMNSVAGASDASRYRAKMERGKIKESDEGPLLKILQQGGEIVAGCMAVLGHASGHD